MVHRRIAHHFAPHWHDDGESHHAHALSLLSLYAYLQIFVLLIAGVYIIRVKAPHILGTASFGASEIISFTNAKRAENGLPALLENGRLDQAAAAKAADMLAENYWAHSSPSGKTPWTFISAAGYRYVYAGENLARDFTDPSSVVNAWMDSSSHRSNILDKNFREIGVAVVSGNLTGREGILVVQLFGSGVSAPSPSLALAPSPAPSPTQVPQQAVTKPKVSPSPVSSPSPSPNPTPEESPTPELAALPLASQGQPTTVLASRQFAISKLLALGMVGFIFVLFLFEAVVAAKSAAFTLRRGLISHLALLGFVLLALWYAVGGAVL